MFRHYLGSYVEKRGQMNQTKLNQADLESPCRELSNGGLGIVVALLVFRELIFRVRVLGIQSSRN